MAAMFWNVSTGRIYFSFPAPLNSRIVSGTKMISETSLVTNMDVKKTPKTRKRVRVVMRCIREARRISGRKMFSFLNPSSTHSIIRSVPRVRQSISLSRRSEGGVMIMAAAAASSDRVSIISRLKKPSTFFINPHPYPFMPGTVPGRSAPGPEETISPVCVSEQSFFVKKGKTGRNGA